MPKAYRITNKDTGETFTASFDHTPTDEEVDKIVGLRQKTHEQQTSSLAQADEASKMFTLPNVSKAVTDTLPSVGSALMMGVAPEFGLPLVGANLAKGIYDAYQKPSKENFGNIGEQLGYGLMGGVGGSNPKLLGTGEGPLVTPPPEGGPQLQLPPHPITAEFDKNATWSPHEPIIIPPTAPTQIPGQTSIKQIGPGRVIQASGEVLPEASGVSASKPVKGLFTKPGLEGSRRKSYYKGESGETIPSKATNPETPKEIPQEQNLPDEHKWIKNLEDTVLMELHRGSPDAIKPYIEDVMKKRGIVLPTENN